MQVYLIWCNPSIFDSFVTRAIWDKDVEETAFPISSVFPLDWRAIVWGMRWRDDFV